MLLTIIPSFRFASSGDKLGEGQKI